MASSEGGELWRECIRWLADLQALPAEVPERLLNSSNGMQEFAQMLKDGVVPCRIANAIQKGAIPDNEIILCPSTSQFACHKNICAFLGACASFGIAQNDLFSASDLYMLSNFSKVLATLSKLSHTEVALRLNVQPFPNRNHASCSGVAGPCTDPPSEEEAIYKSLEDMDEVNLDSAVYDTGYRNVEDKSVIYDSIVCQRRDSQRKRPEDQWAQFAPKNSRDHSIKELLDTEQNYVEKALNMIITKFYTPLQSVMKPEDHKNTFMNIQELWKLHHQFYADLRAAVLNTLDLEPVEQRPSAMPRMIGDVFVIHKDRFIAYGPYCMGLGDSRKLILTLEGDPIMRAKIAECTASVNDNQFKLQDLLCLPMQRVLKYHMLLSAIKKHTPIDSPDRRSIDQAKEAMEDVNSYVNEMKRDYETKQLVMNIQSSILNLSMPDGMTLTDYGRIHIDEEVRLCEVSKESSNPTRTKQRHVFLFDKVLIICKANRGATYSYKSAYVLAELRLDVENNLNGDKLGTFTRKLNGTHWLTLVRDDAKADGVRAINMSFKKMSTMQQWYHKIETAKDNARPKEAEGTGHVMHMANYPNDRPHKCGVCDQLLKGLYFQGYKCDVCQQSFHKECIRSRKCMGPKRRTTTSGTPDSFGLQRKPSTVVGGDRVKALNRFTSSDPDFLSFDKDDVIIVQVVHNDSTFTGMLPGKNQNGRVRLDQIQRLRSPSAVMDTPIGAGPAFRLDRKSTTVLPRPISRMINPSGPTQDYVNTEIAQQLWYKGDMERKEAEKKLSKTPSGTFLVRYSTNRRSYAISISYEREIKHMAIEFRNNLYFLDEGYVFATIVELINYYRDHSLIESFQSLNTTLRTPYNKCKVFRVVHEYEAPEPKFLELRKGDTVVLVDTVGEDRGWWKGRINNKVGFFPRSYVEAISDSEED